MTLPFFGNRRVPPSASASDSPEETEMMVVGSVPTPSSGCNFERACAAFHAAHDSIVALIREHDEFDVDGLPELHVQRDEAFKQIRTKVARTKSAYEAKVRVLIIMQKWFDFENPDISKFATELAVEAMALFANDRDEECACHRAREEVVEHRSNGAERRNPFSWFARPSGNITDTPFAN